MTKTLIHLGCYVFVIAYSQIALASGVFDFLDPCIAAKEDYWDTRGNILRAVDLQIGSIDKEKANTQFTLLWWEEKEKVLRKAYEEQYGKVIRAAGGDVETGYIKWLASVIQEGGGPDKIQTDIIDKEYRRVKKLKAQKEKGAIVADLEKSKKDLYEGCPSDVGNQILRLNLLIYTAPIGWASKNFESAKNESGELSKVTKALGGISLDDMATHGVLGGENSEARKAANAIAGGENSEVRKGLRAIDPSNWKF